MMREAGKIGPATIALIEAIMKAKPHPEQGFRACLGILRLARSYGSARIEAACRRGNDIGATTYGSIKSILQHGLDRAYANDEAAGRTTHPTPQHPRHWLLPLRKGETMLTHPTLDRLVTLGLTGMAKALRRTATTTRHHSTRLRRAASLCWSIARRPSARTSGW